MDLEDDHESLFGELFGSQSNKAARIISPKSPATSATKIQEETSNDSDSDDDFALPSAPATDEAPSPVKAEEPRVDGGSGSSAGAGAAAAAAGGAPAKPKAEEEQQQKEEEEKADSENETATESKKPKFDQTKFDAFPQPTNQRDTYWDSITPEQLIWYGDCPALVVPEKLHFHVLCSAPKDGVRAYGPSSTSVQPLKKRYVVIQYFPLCVTCHDTPKTQHACVKGAHVERVLPYNTVMAKKPGEGRGLGPKDKWADTNHHYLKAKAKYKRMSKENWDASMAYVHKFLARALERETELAAQAVEDNRLAEEELEQQRQEREAEEAEEAAAAAARADEEGGEAGADSADAPDAAPEPQRQPIVYVKGLPLAPGDRIVYWDRMKRTGAADGRMEATVLQIRSKKAAREENLVLLVLDNNHIVLDDWVIQRYVKNEETGEVTVAREACMVKDHNLKRGKLKGRDPLKNDRMAALIKGFRKGMKAYGAGDQLRSMGGGGGGETDTDSSDDESSGSGDESCSSTEAQSKATTKGKARGSVAKKRGGGSRGRGGSSGSRGVGGSASGGRKAPPSTEEDEEDAVAASIARVSKKAKQPGGGGSAKTHTKAKEKSANKQETSAGKGGGGGARKQEAARKASTSKKTEAKEETAARKAAAGATKKRSGGSGGGGGGGGERGGENAPDAKRHYVDLTSASGARARAAGEPKPAKKRRTFSSSLVTPVSDATEPEGPQKKRPKKQEQQTKRDATGQQGAHKKKPNKQEQQSKADATDQQGPHKKKPKKQEQESKADITEQQGPREKKPEKAEQRSKSPVLPGGGGAGSAGGGGDRSSHDSELKSTTKAPAPKASTAPNVSGWQQRSQMKLFKPPRPAATAKATAKAATGASNSEPVREKPIEWRIPKKKTQPNGGAPAE